MDKIPGLVLTIALFLLQSSSRNRENQSNLFGVPKFLGASLYFSASLFWDTHSVDTSPTGRRERIYCVPCPLLCAATRIGSVKYPL